MLLRAESGAWHRTLAQSFPRTRIVHATPCWANCFLKLCFSLCRELDGAQQLPHKPGYEAGSGTLVDDRAIHSQSLQQNSQLLTCGDTADSRPRKRSNYCTSMNFTIPVHRQPVETSEMHLTCGKQLHICKSLIFSEAWRDSIVSFHTCT